MPVWRTGGVRSRYRGKSGSVRRLSNASEAEEPHSALPDLDAAKQERLPGHFRPVAVQHMPGRLPRSSLRAESEEDGKIGNGVGQRVRSCREVLLAEGGELKKETH